jgi:hypothetical protein
VDCVETALKGVEADGDTAEVALRLARRVERYGATPSAVRELRYALLALGVQELDPYRQLMVATKSAIDASDDSLPTLAAQLREQEQTCRQLSAEPVNAPAARAVREAVDGLVAGWAQAWDEYLAGVETDWRAHRAESKRLWKIVDTVGGPGVFPEEEARALEAFDRYWQGRIRRRRALAGVAQPQWKG